MENNMNFAKMKLQDAVLKYMYSHTEPKTCNQITEALVEEGIVYTRVYLYAVLGKLIKNKLLKKFGKGSAAKLASYYRTDVEIPLYLKYQIIPKKELILLYLQEQTEPKSSKDISEFFKLHGVKKKSNISLYLYLLEKDNRIEGIDGYNRKMWRIK